MTNSVDLHDPRILRGRPKDMAPVVKMAARLGWSGSVTSAGGLRLQSPVDATVVRVPNSTRTDPSQARRNASLIMRHSDQALVAEYTGSLGKAVKQAIEDDVTPGEEFLDEVEMVAEAINVLPGASFGAPTLAPEPPKVVTSETPWLAKKGQVKAGSQRYESAGVLERTWSDGSKDYLCPICREYTHHNPRSVAIHAAGHTRRGEKKPLDVNAREVVATVPGDDTVHRTEQRIARLAKEILAAELEVGGRRGDMTGEEWATALASRIIGLRGDRQESEPHEATPVTPEGLLGQIRALVAADLVQQRATLEATVEAQAAALAAADEMILRARAEAARYKESLSVFAEMAREAASEREETDDGSGDRAPSTTAPSPG